MGRVRLWSSMVNMDRAFPHDQDSRDRDETAGWPQGNHLVNETTRENEGFGPLTIKDRTSERLEKVMWSDESRLTLFLTDGSFRA